MSGINIVYQLKTYSSCVGKMELIQIIESTVFIFSLGLFVLLILSYLLFKVKNRSSAIPVYNPDRSDQMKIIYEKPIKEESTNTRLKSSYNERFTIVNEIMRESNNRELVSRRIESNPRYYIYKPGRNRIITNLQLSRIKE